MKINTTPGETYIVLSTGGCTVTTGAGNQIKKLAAGQDFFTAMTGDSILSDDNASVAVAKGEMLSLLNLTGSGSDVQATLRFQPVASQSDLPATGENGVIYLVPNGKTAPNQYTEWVWTESAYEQLGDASVDLSGYVSKEELGITSIEVGETGPKVTSDATLITNAAQVDNLKVGGTLSVMNVLASGEVEVPSIRFSNSNLRLGVRASEITTCHIGSGCNIAGEGWDASWQEAYARLTSPVSELLLETNSSTIYRKLHIGRDTQGGNTVEISLQTITRSGLYNEVLIHPDKLRVVGLVEVAEDDSALSITNMATLAIGKGSTITGEGWEAIVADIQAGAAAAAAAVEPEQPSFTKLTFPPAGTATEEQDPSWITKKNILMETNGGQLNMTQLTATLSYAAQTPLAIANKTLWLSTSSGTGDAVQWPDNAVFPDDQSQDKIQQLNSNSTYWFDITYVGGSDTVLIRKVCSWAATTGESGPTE